MPPIYYCCVWYFIFCGGLAVLVPYLPVIFRHWNLSPSQIGIILRDNHGIPQVSTVTNSKIMRILKGQGLAPTLPEDLYCLIKKAVSVRKHLERNRKDMDSKFRLILIESRIHRLARYYRLAKKLEPNWRYESSTASTLLTK